MLGNPVFTGATATSLQETGAAMLASENFLSAAIAGDPAQI
jgi:hypothetical protein